MEMNNRKTGTTVIVMGMMLGASSLGQAQTPETDLPGFYPSVELAYKHDDNIFRQENNEESDDIFSVSPDLVWRWFLGKHRLTAEYLGDYATYDTNDDENYDDHFLSADLLLDLTPKFNVDLQANYNRGHEARGSSGILPGNVSTKPNEWKESRLFGQLTYGRRIANAQFQLDLEAKDLEYTNNNQDFRDRDTDSVAGRFFYKIAPKTSAILEAEHRDIDYTNSAIRDLDSTERYYRVGLRWEATYKTTGELKVGRFEKDFDSAAEEDNDGVSVVGKVTWEPRTYSRFTFTALRQPNETATADSSYTSELVSADWQHDFSSRVSLNANISDGTDDYTGTREDDLFNAGLGLNYKMRRWLDLGVAYNYSERDSNAPTASFDDNIFMLRATLRLPR
ncbi:outer membrane beta-barrel protein [Sulfuriflexus mobilis]|uniref:outer membrane beta-barrel protein n=1 Tax=Sulfuriflexus mobilis TaxID=1811807 RepID=UPI000F845787|nr:outer membrane beta-barrel protein [Sulfuriflexus mobilis]